jgi:hypothetical protein
MKKKIKQILFKYNLSNILYYKKNLSYFFLDEDLPNQDKEIVICGMPRSGSTLVYNLVKEINGFDQKFIYVKDNKEYIEAVRKGYKLIKCHTNLPIIKKRVSSNKAIGIFTHRNLLDIAISFVQKKRNTIEEIIEQQILQNISYKALDLAKVKNMVLISYEDEISSVENLIHKILKTFGSKIENDKVSQIAEKYSRQKVNKIGKNVTTADVKNKFKLNAINGFHENHFFDGKSDKYINLLDISTIKILANQTKDFNTFFSYDILIKNSHE